MNVLSRIIPALFVLMIIYPIFFVVQTSLKSDEDILRNFWWFPQRPIIANYVDTWIKYKIGEYFLNSVVVVTISTTVIVYFSLLAAYALAKMGLRHATAILGLLVFTMFLPGEMNILPLSFMFSRLNLMRKYITLILPYVAWSLPISIYIIHGYIVTMQGDILEAARIDGANEIRIFHQLVFPLSGPPVACVVIIQFCVLWGEYLWAVISLQGGGPRTLPLGLANFSSYLRIPWGQYSAAVTIVIIPLIILFILFQKNITTGLTNGAIKG